MTATTQGIHTKIDDLHARLNEVHSELEQDLEDVEQSLIDDSMDKVTDKLKEIPEFIKEHSLFFLALLFIVIFWLLLILGNFILTFINTGFLCIILSKINQIDLLILKKK